MTMKKITAKQILLEYLKENSIAASKSKVGINFQVDGWNFLLWHDADNNYAQALMACNTLNWNYKVVKASLYEYEEAGKRHASVWVCYEQLFDGSVSDTELVPRAIQALMEAAEHFQSLLES